jgi:hypothetical protein
MNLFIDYFTPEERLGALYTKSIESIKDTDLHFAVNTKAGFLNQIRNRDLTAITHITILTHGVNDTDFICKDGISENFISYSELVATLNSTINGANIILNLAGICESSKVKTYVDLLDIRFFEIWISEAKTPYMEVPIKMVYNGFDYFIYDKDEDDIYFRQVLNTN